MEQPGALFADADGLVARLGVLAVDLAHGAGEVARTGRRSGFAVSTKSTDTDLVTDVDRRVEAWLRDQLGRLRPADGVLGEEGGQTGERQHGAVSGVRWVLDPIDGTVNFALGLPHYGVSVAAELDGEVVAGCVHDPETGATFHATRRGGAWLGGARLHGAPDVRLHGGRDVSLARAVIGTGFAYAAATRAHQASVVAGMLGRIGDIRRMGAASLDICAAAAGWLDGFFETGLNPWDYAAGVLIAREAGCGIRGPGDGPPGPGLVAVASPGLAGEFFAMLDEFGVGG